ncbi:MAG: LLM class flavin-dependent oxidoreductase, partial [Dehalococcoidia bacterium]
DIDIQGWRRAQSPARDRVPIYAGAMQEGMCRMAGEVADGIMPHTICTPRWMKEVMEPNLAIGLKRAGRERREFDLTAAVSVAITGDRRQAIEDFRGSIAFQAVTRAYQRIFAWHGYEKEAAQIREVFIERGYTREVLDAVPDEMVEAFTIIGTADEVRARIGELEGLADSVFFGQTGYGLDYDRRQEYRKAIYETFAR